MIRDATGDSPHDPLDETALSDRVEQTAVSSRRLRRIAAAAADPAPAAEVDDSTVLDGPTDLDDKTIAIQREDRMPVAPPIGDDEDTVRAVRPAPRSERAAAAESPARRPVPDRVDEPTRTAGARIAQVPAITHARYQPRRPEPGDARRESRATPVVRPGGGQPAVDARTIARDVGRAARRRALLLATAVVVVLGAAATALVLLLSGALA